MKLLATGAFAQSESELDVFKEQGFDVVFHKDERSPLECDPSEIDVVICNGLFLYCDVALFSNLKAIQLTSAGLDRVPVEEIERRGIKLFNARGVYSVPMAEYVLANVLAVYRENAFYAEMQREKRWEKKRDLDELFGKTLCVVGAGNVGGEVAKRFRAFGVKTIGVDNHVAPRPDFDEIVPLDELYEIAKKADIIVSTVPLIEPIRGTVDATQRNATQRNATQRNATRGMFDKAFFSHMKTSAIFVNISRGGVVVESDLIEALREKQIRHAILDVFESEPLEENSALWELSNATITPHSSFISIGNKKRLFEVAQNNMTSVRAKQ